MAYWLLLSSASPAHVSTAHQTCHAQCQITRGTYVHAHFYTHVHKDVYTEVPTPVYKHVRVHMWGWFGKPRWYVCQQAHTPHTCPMRAPGYEQSRFMRRVLNMHVARR